MAISEEPQNLFHPRTLTPQPPATDKGAGGAVILEGAQIIYIDGFGLL